MTTASGPYATARRPAMARRRSVPGPRPRPPEDPSGDRRLPRWADREASAAERAAMTEAPSTSGFGPERRRCRRAGSRHRAAPCPLASPRDGWTRPGAGEGFLPSGTEKVRWARSVRPADGRRPAVAGAIDDCVIKRRSGSIRHILDLADETQPHHDPVGRVAHRHDDDARSAELRRVGREGRPARQRLGPRGDAIGEFPSGRIDDDDVVMDVEEVARQPASLPPRPRCQSLRSRPASRNRHPRSRQVQQLQKQLKNKCAVQQNPALISNVGLHRTLDTSASFPCECRLSRSTDGRTCAADRGFPTRREPDPGPQAASPSMLASSRRAAARSTRRSMVATSRGCGAGRPSR